ncbi:hypothetical protein NLU13_9560 [Sarocladium strictum]|uniref:Copper acquisition factor BIM1-like domain-containing protein n=1 Tax=Sarocladium strictum TaxID=5046 RepID=A0AA39GBR3_SARSR|nr:hypothetical protein NLU13_9560 [Sarocladium strictum]
MSTHDDMGPAAFMWPPDRVWSAAADNQAPCGSVAGVGNRTNFPLSAGQIALVTQDEAWDLELSVAHVDNPSSNDDFETLIDVMAFRDLDLGHTCVTVDDSHSSLKVGDKATFQIKYISEFDTPRNQTFYACADIVYVDDVPYDMSSRCFNATLPDTGGDSGSDHSSGDADKDKSGSDNKDSSSSGGGGGGGKSGLSGGAIAGIVIGAVAGVAFLAVAAVFLNRKRQQRLRAERQRERESARNIQKYVNDDGRTNSTPSVRMQNL